MYTDIIEKMKNKVYFYNYFSQVDNQKNIKNTVAQKLYNLEKNNAIAIAFLGLLIGIGISLFTGIPESNNPILVSISFPIVLACVSCFPLLVINKLVLSSISSTKYDIHLKEAKELDLQLFNCLKKYNELLQDLAELVVNEQTEKNFKELINQIMKNDCTDIGFNLKLLLTAYQDYLEKEKKKNRVQEFLNKENIKISKDLYKVPQKEIYHI